MVIGIDFDNTVVCYDEVFHRAARDWGLIPASFPSGKGRVRDYLRERGRDDDWTRLQGHVYGVTIGEAANTVKLTHTEWNDLVSRVRSGELREV